MGVRYDRPDGSARYVSGRDTIDQNLLLFTESGGASPAWYVSTGYSFRGFAAGTSQVIEGDTYVWVGISTPGYSAVSGIDIDGDLSGYSGVLPTGRGAMVVDPFNFQLTAYEFGRTGPYLTASLNGSQAVRDFNLVNRTVESFSLFANEFIRHYYPSDGAGGGGGSSDPNSRSQLYYDSASFEDFEDTSEGSEDGY